MSGHFVVDMTKLTSAPLSGPPKRERRAFQNPAFSPPQKLGYPEATHGARSQLVRPRCSSQAARPTRVVDASRLPAVKKGTDGRGSLASWPVFFTAAGVWSSTTRQMIATWLPFNYPALHTRAGHIALVLWPPGEPPVSQCAGHLRAVATCSRHGCGVVWATSGPVSRASGGV